jgi:hypothetical protein
MITIEATIPCSTPPAWAVLERKLMEVMDQSVYPYLEKYTREDGTLIYRDDFRSRDGADDFYESFYNWPLFYILGGGEHMLSLAHREWEAITRQLTAYGNAYKEYERGYDQFHQAESYIYFYLLCLADPTNPRLVERARRFAGLYLNEDPEAPNYDPEHKLIRGPHNGSTGPHAAMGDGEARYGYSAGMARYGLPYADVPGITSYEDLKDPALARRMGQVMRARMSQGDVVANLGVTSLVTNAYLLTADEKYRRWVLEYTDAWVERTRQNGGLLPDNVGLSGKIGEYINGKWYGGSYGWTWPHGFYNIGMTATVAAGNAFLLTRDPRYLDLSRAQMDRILSLGTLRNVDELEMSLAEHWEGVWKALGAECKIFVVPYRYGDAGWFDYQPMTVIYPTAVWNLSMDGADWERIELIRRASTYDWRTVSAFRNKEDAGHEEPWLRYLAGDNPGYPEAILSASYGQVCRRLEQIRQDRKDLMKVHVHHWQQLNPVLTEALIQLTLGAPQILYNGGLLFSRLRYFDLEKRRPGLPQDVAALVEKLEPGRTALRLINLSPFQARDVLIQAGAFGEHRFIRARYPVRASDYPGETGTYAAPELHMETNTTPIEDKVLHVHMPAATEIVLELETARFVNQGSYALPW